MKTVHIPCQCNDLAHTIQLSRSKYHSEDKNVYIQYHLDNGNFFTRLKLALDYILSGELIISDTIIDASKQQEIIEFLGEKNEAERY